MGRPRGRDVGEPMQSIHNIVMTTEEAVNEVLIRQRFIKNIINRWNTQDR